MINNNILISVIMPAYNAEKTIKDSIYSVVNQSYTNWELLVINDASSDNTGIIIQQIEKTDSRIHAVENNKNSGVSYSRNIGVQMAKAAWIAFIDSDDIWDTHKLEKQLELLYSQPDASLVFTGSSFIKGEVKSSYILKVPLNINYRQLLKQNIISCSSVLVKRELLLKYPMRHDEMHEDFAVWLQLLKNGYKAYGVCEPLLIYRLSGKSKSSNKKKAILMTYKVYRFIGLNFIEAIYYLFCYSMRNLRKYKAISNGFNQLF